MGRKVGPKPDEKGIYDDRDYLVAISVASVMVPPGYEYVSYSRDLLLGEPAEHLYGAYADDLARGTDLLKC